MTQPVNPLFEPRKQMSLMSVSDDKHNQKICLLVFWCNGSLSMTPLSFAKFWPNCHFGLLVVSSAGMANNKIGENHYLGVAEGMK